MPQSKELFLSNRKVLNPFLFEEIAVSKHAPSFPPEPQSYDMMVEKIYLSLTMPLG